MDDRQLEELLLRYRPAEPATDLIAQITQSPNHQITKSAWLWSAAAALFVVAVALHGVSFTASPDYSQAERQREIAEVTAALGEGSLDHGVAALIVQREHARAEQQR
ncbi:MAG TPA: hypothetical protein VGF24_16015 [Vicinamibacterales bacterium]|jgi:hypothetical protein